MTLSTYQIDLKLTSPLGSPFHSDTLFGAFCWRYRERFGESALVEILENNAEPPIIFSNAFWVEHVDDNLELPKPILEPFALGRDDPIEDYAKLKKYKKKSTIPSEWILNNQGQPITDKILFEHFKKIDEIDKSEMEYKTENVLHNSIDRLTGTVIDGGLFSQTKTFFKKAGLRLFIKTILPKSEFIEILRDMGIVGIGRDASTGMGHFEVGLDSIEENPSLLKPVGKVNAFISLSNGFIDSQDQNCQLYYGKTITKFSKHGGELAYQGLPWKNPMQMYTAGSVFRFTAKKDFYGQYLEQVSSISNHRTAAFLFPLFIQIPPKGAAECQNK